MIASTCITHFNKFVFTASIQQEKLNKKWPRKKIKKKKTKKNQKTTTYVLISDTQSKSAENCFSEDLFHDALPCSKPSYY